MNPSALSSSVLYRIVSPLIEFSRLEFPPICTQSTTPNETSTKFMSQSGSLAILGICMTTEMFFTISQWVHEIALERSWSYSLPSITHWQVTCSNVESLGILETRLIIANIMSNFNIQPCKKTASDWMDQKAFVGFEKKPLFVRLTPRYTSNTAVAKCSLYQ